MAENRNENKNWIERNSTTISTLATVSIPVVIAIFGYFANRSLQQDELDQSYVVLAINTLKTELPVNERTECIKQVNALEPDGGGQFTSAADLAQAFQNFLTSSATTDSTATTSANPSATTVAVPASTSTNLPQTLFRSYALDLLLASTPATLTVPQYKALLCAETIVPPLTDQPVEPRAETEELDADKELFNRLEVSAGEADSVCEVVITGDVKAVGGTSLSADPTAYPVMQVAFDRDPALAGAGGGSTVPATDVTDPLFLQIDVEPDREDGNLLWIQSQANVKIQPDRETCTP